MAGSGLWLMAAARVVLGVASELWLMLARLSFPSAPRMRDYATTLLCYSKVV